MYTYTYTYTYIYIYIYYQESSYIQERSDINYYIVIELLAHAVI